MDAGYEMNRSRGRLKLESSGPKAISPGDMRGSLVWAISGTYAVSTDGIIGLSRSIVLRSVTDLQIVAAQARRRKGRALT